MRQSLIVLLFISLASPAFAQGSIRNNTPITFVAPSSITDWEPFHLGLWPGDNARIVVEIVAQGRPDVKLTFDYPRDCGSFGSTLVDGKQVPNPPTCPNRDTSAEIDDLITALANLNLSTTNLWRRVFTNVCNDFPEKFPGGCTVQ